MGKGNILNTKHDIQNKDDLGRDAHNAHNAESFICSTVKKGSRDYIYKIRVIISKGRTEINKVK